MDGSQLRRYCPRLSTPLVFCCPKSRIDLRSEKDGGRTAVEPGHEHSGTCQESKKLSELELAKVIEIDTKCPGQYQPKTSCCCRTRNRRALRYRQAGPQHIK